MTEPMKKTYLGDGVYCEYDGFYWHLYTADGVTRSNQPIYLDDTTANNLEVFIEHCKKESNQ